MNGYNLTRRWYQFKFDNPTKTRHIHSDMYFYIIDLWNRLGQKNEFGLPTATTMEMLCIGSYNTYKKCIDELQEFGFIEVVKNSRNQHSSKIIKLCKLDTIIKTSLDSALLNALSNNDKPTAKASDKPTAKASDTIDKQINNETINVVTHPFIDYIKSECPNVAKMKSMLTIKEADRLVEEFDKTILADIVNSMDNYADLGKYVSTNKTIRAWIKLRKERNPIPTTTIKKNMDGLTLN